MKRVQCEYNCKRGVVFNHVTKQDEPCPVHGNIDVVLETEDEKTGFTPYMKLDIPVQYRVLGTTDEELLNFNGSGAYTQDSLLEVGTVMKRVNTAIYNHEIYSLSFYLYASNQVDTRRFVYGAQKLAIEKGLSVSPFISANVLYGLQRVGDFSLTSIRDLTLNNGALKEVHPDMMHAVDGYRMVQNTELTYFDYVNADICFIDATANTTEKGWTGLADLLGERSKRNLPTYVIGYWGSRNPQAGRGLRYLISGDTSFTRLDLLVPYELKSSKGQNNVTMSRDVPTATSAGSSLGGLSLKDL